MKLRAVMIAMLLISVAVEAQELNFKMHHGDVLVYEESASLDISIVRLRGSSRVHEFAVGDPVDTAYIGKHGASLWPYFFEISGGDVLDWRQQTIDEAGIVYQGRHDMDIDFELFPTSVPPSDTLYLLNLRRGGHQWSFNPVYDTAYNFHAFDTVVCGADVRAIRFNRRNGDTVSTIVVADIFGIVSVRGTIGNWRLTSATIGGKKYAHDTRKFAAFPSCAGSKFYYETQYTHYEQPSESIFTIYELRETRVNGVNYVLPGAMLWNVPEGAAFRVERGIVSIPEGGSERLLDSAISLGSWTAYGVVVDTGALLFAGEQYRFIQTQQDNKSYTWLEGLGLWKVSTGYWGAGSTTTLRYANICGKEYGTRVNIPETPISIRLFQAPFPNPVPSNYGTLHFYAKYPLFGSFSFSLFDALGREVHRSTEDAPLHVGIPIAGLAPGVYYLYITGNQLRETYKIMIQ